MIKSIFARPVFINPQAYLVIPQLANLSMLEPIDFTSTNTYSFESLGKVESKIISAKDEYILHIDLYESYGSCVLGEFYIGPATIGSIDDFTITTNGYITTIEVGGGDSGNIVYPGLIAAWSAKGKTNDDEDRAILKDLTGNGHDITLNGFAFSEMNGYGGYNYDFTKNFFDTIKPTIKNSLTFEINGYPKDRRVLEKNYGISTTLPLVIKKLKIKATIKNNTTDAPIKLYTTGGDAGTDQSIQITTSGVYEIKEYTVNSMTSLYGVYIGFVFNNENVVSLENPDYYCKIELLPEYPDALVFDGVDDYGQSIDRIKALTKYTIILKRKIIKATNGGCVLYKGDLRYDDSTENFGVEFTDNKYWYYYSGLLGNNKIIPYQKDIIYAKEKSYNGQQMNSNLDNVADNPIVISTVNKTGFVNMAFYSAYLFDRSLDEQEIKEFIRKYIDPEYLLPSEIPTPDCYYDFSLGSNDDENRETIKDQSGNGNDAKAYNIAWSGMSGYGGYDIDFKTEYQNTLNTNRVTGTLSSTKFNITSVKNVNAFLESARLETHPSYKVKVTGVSDNLYLTYQYGTSNYFHIKTEGIHTIPAVETETQYVGFKVSSVTENCNITLELIPQYPGALVLDGVDDYISLDAFDSGFKTIFMVCTFFSPDLFIYDQRNNTRDNENAVTSNNGEPCYYGRNKSGITYINGLLNDYKYGHENSIYPVNTKGKKHLITCAIINGVNTTTPIIANRYDKGYQYLKMNLYKFLGFKEALTEEQIQAIIKKYNLLDGVDEIEIS